MRLTIALAARLLVVLSLGGCILQPTQTPDCAGATRCGECTGRAGCGWCEGLDACVPGSSFGPDDPACALSDWRFTGCADPPGAVGGCHEDSECGGCLYVLGGGASDCQWCPASGECLDLDETCSAGTPTFDYDTCTEDTCRAQTTCGACTSMGTSCRWCDQGGGSCTDSYACDPHYEFGSRDRCPPPNTCSSYFGCESCTAQPGCGWCDAPGPDAFCVAVDGFGDYADWCSSGDLSLEPLACP